MSSKRDRKEAVKHLRAAWTEVYLDPFRNSPENKRKRAAILEKIRKWRIDK